jgi:glycosyltransferase involved in cell wall biosynthesis
MHRAGALRATRNVTISQYQRRRLALPRDQVVYNPVARRAFAAGAPGPGTPGLVAFAGRLVAEKGVDHLLRALVACPDAQLEIAGDGDRRADLERLADDLGLRRRVRFLGALPASGVAELYARAAVVCVPSLWHEPFGYSAAEAMAMQRPVVATPSGALVELLADGRGYVASDMEPASLATALTLGLSDEAARERTAACARDFAADEVSIDVVGPRYAEIYREAVA